MVPTTLRPMFMPEPMSSCFGMSGRFWRISTMPAETSMARSMTAPELERKIAPM